MLSGACNWMQQTTKDLAFFGLFVCSLAMYGTGAMFAIQPLTNSAGAVLTGFKVGGDCLLVFPCSYGRMKQGPLDACYDCKAV